MSDPLTLVIGGVDCHQQTHHAVALNDHGQRLGDQAFAATSHGYAQLLSWLQQFGRIHAVGVESTASYGAGLARHLLAADIPVVEVNQPHRHLRTRRGKTDAIDAEGAARKVLSGEASALPKDTTGSVEAIRQLRLVRASAVKARTAALEQLGELTTTAPAALRERMGARTSLHTWATSCARLRPELSRLEQSLEAAKLALRSLGQRILALDAEIASFDAHLSRLVSAVAPRTTALLGLGTLTTAQLLVTLGQNAERIGDEAAFAHLCGAAPIPASSGKTNRHRLNPGGDRQANAALYLIAICRLRYCPRTQAYAVKRTAQGRSKREILRCLKRYIAREVYHTLRADLAAHHASSAPASSTS
ncbi:MAG: IS110 family transposase [Chloroflexi bacterium]|nr:IS110 family transposase [Chloroflexota bacterium]